MSEGSSVARDTHAASYQTLQPSGWPRPKGYANGVMARGDLIFIAGQIGWDTQGALPSGFVAQVRQALENILAILAAGNAGAEHIVRMTWFVTDMDIYQADLPALGKTYREVIGRNFPAMSVVEINRLDVPGAMVEIEATAVVPR
ncbi:MAG: RidA family protein [Rhizobiales bacterium]|nr:RidA family protein [Hyphomicrobiales bacterium]